VTFVCESEGIVVVTMPQEYLRTIKIGNEVEVCLDALPGLTLPGKVEALILASGQGQSAPTGLLPTFLSTSKAARIPIKVRLDGAELARYQIPAGGHGAAAIYTDYGKPFRIVRRVTLRWYTWLNYVKLAM
jgi:multidrug resistance efflux pump